MGWKKSPGPMSDEVALTGGASDSNYGFFPFNLLLVAMQKAWFLLRELPLRLRNQSLALRLAIQGSTPVICGGVGHN
ncbi:hypothetical protein C4J81_14020 [Deltaproteobacteria bacterium Smac51]|nr:hypothetical protein C4J81_14020 [Deltaproteobacteria bacterium Smac51]